MESQKTLNRQRYLGEKTEWTILNIYWKFLYILKHMLILYCNDEISYVEFLQLA